MSNIIGVIVALLYFGIARLSYCRFKSFIAPGVIMPIIWGLILLLYNTLDTVLYPLSYDVYIILSIWVLCFVFGANIFSRVKVGESLLKYTDVNGSILTIYLVLYAISFPFIVYKMYQMGGADIGSFFLRLRLAQVGLTDEEINYGVLRYMMSLMLVLFLIELYRHKASSTKMKWLLFFNFFSIIATMAKTQMFWLLLPTFVILYKRKKLSKKILSLGIVLLIGIFALVQTLRGGGGGENETSLFETFISIYLLGGLPAFDQIVQANITSPVFGYCTLAFFRKILCIDLSNVESQMSSVFNEGIPGYAYVPLPTNVFTCLANPYLDFGITGIAVFALLSGSICGFFYKLLRKDVVWGTIGYSYLFSTICLQFFDDCLFKMMSQFLQFVLISWFACYFSKRIVIGKLHL